MKLYLMYLLKWPKLVLARRKTAGKDSNLFCEDISGRM